MNPLRNLLLPFSWLYGIGVWIRNKFFDWGFFSSKEFDVPVICVGNLTAGGTGKTPHVEYLIRLLQNNNKIATLSRGYGRHTKGFLVADTNSTSYEIGDEPKQYAQKFPNVTVAVDGDRVGGIKKLLAASPAPDVILLDDAFQHRWVKPALSILLTDHGRLFYKDKLLPAGMLREPAGGASRADVIIVTKTPDPFTPMEQRIIIKEIKPRPHQQIYFSFITYGDPVSFWGTNDAVKTVNEYSAENYSVLMLAGIANPEPLRELLGKKFKNVVSLCFPDHHEYGVVDLERMKAAFHTMPGDKKIIVTTEKDAMRLDKAGLQEFIQGLPILYIPIEVRFRENGEQGFDQCIFELMKR